MTDSSLTFKKRNNINIIILKGSLDLPIIPSLKEQTVKFLEENSKKILVDIHDVSYIDSSGIGLLIYIARTIYNRKGIVKFVIPTGFVFDVLHMVHFDKLFDVFKTRENALKAFQ